MVARTEECGCGEAGALAERVDERRFHRAFGEMIALHRAADGRHRLADPAWISREQDWLEIGIDRELHTLWAFRPIGQAADGGALANAHNAVRHEETDNHQGLAADGRHRQLMRADRRQVDQERLNPFDMWLGLRHGVLLSMKQR